MTEFDDILTPDDKSDDDQPSWRPARQWRVLITPEGAWMFFDPKRETPAVRELSPDERGYPARGSDGDTEEKATDQLEITLEGESP